MVFTIALDLHGSGGYTDDCRSLVKREKQLVGPEGISEAL
jgi:hypothetical protein